MSTSVLVNPYNRPQNSLSAIYIQTLSCHTSLSRVATRLQEALELKKITKEDGCKTVVDSVGIYVSDNNKYQCGREKG